MVKRRGRYLSYHPFSNFHTTPTGGCLSIDRFYMHRHFYKANLQRYQVSQVVQTHDTPAASPLPYPLSYRGHRSSVDNADHFIAMITHSVNLWEISRFRWVYHNFESSCSHFYLNSIDSGLSHFY
ncbi:hypothetical protein TNCV_701281 [Trichonephila clavipes]|nr:hypothetical protein TNCV_701281 [Trichonephila clavipes]